jgi:hypothetical protein
MLAAVASEPEKAPEKFRAFGRLALQVAEGAHPWPEPGRELHPSEPAPEAATPTARTATKATRPTLNWD